MARANILIVDDDTDLTEALRVLLEGEQYHIITAGSRIEGMEKIQAERLDLLILDVMMSACQDGFEMARELKKDTRFKHIPILLITGIRGKTGIDFKLAAGDPEWCPVDGFLDKPVEPSVLLAEVRRLLHR